MFPHALRLRSFETWGKFETPFFMGHRDVIPKGGFRFYWVCPRPWLCLSRSTFSPLVPLILLKSIHFWVLKSWPFLHITQHYKKWHTSLSRKSPDHHKASPLNKCILLCSFFLNKLSKQHLLNEGIQSKGKMTPTIPSELLVVSASESAFANAVPPVSWSDTTSGGVGSWRREGLVELWLDKVVRKRSSVKWAHMYWI